MDIARKLYFTLKFQQLTGPVMAKGLEDTACYVYTRFISVNEVGGSPAEFGISLAEFHRGNRSGREQWPHSMLTTSTHDTKRSEDVRARLDVLSEMPRRWASAGDEVASHQSRRAKRSSPMAVACPTTTRNTFCIRPWWARWPLRHGERGASAENLSSRIQQYMEKAMHEAKVNLSWLNPNPQYVRCHEFVRGSAFCQPRGAARLNLFRDSLQKFMPPVIYFGLINSLAQTVLKLTCPGVPDVYQGQELWDFSLVDPDNRRPVDFEVRTRMLEWLPLNSHVKASDLRIFATICCRLLHDGRSRCGSRRAP